MPAGFYIMLWPAVSGFSFFISVFSCPWTGGYCLFSLKNRSGLKKRGSLTAESETRPFTLGKIKGAVSLKNSFPAPHDSSIFFPLLILWFFRQQGENEWLEESCPAPIFLLAPFSLLGAGVKKMPSESLRRQGFFSVFVFSPIGCLCFCGPMAGKRLLSRHWKNTFFVSLKTGRFMSRIFLSLQSFQQPLCFDFLAAKGWMMTGKKLENDYQPGFSVVMQPDARFQDTSDVL